MVKLYTCKYFFFYQLSQLCSEKFNTGCILVIKLSEIARSFFFFFKRQALNMLLLRLGSSSWAQGIFTLPNLLGSRTAHCKSITTAVHSLYSTCGLTQRLASNSERHYHPCPGWVCIVTRVEVVVVVGLVQVRGHLQVSSSLILRQSLSFKPRA